MVPVPARGAAAETCWSSVKFNWSPRCVSTGTELVVSGCRSASKGFFPIKVLKFPSSVANTRGLAAGWESGSGLDLITLGCNKSGLWVADKEMGWALWSLQGDIWIKHCPLLLLFWLEDFEHINTQIFFHSSSSRKDKSLISLLLFLLFFFFFFFWCKFRFGSLASLWNRKKKQPLEMLCRQTKHHPKSRCLLAPEGREAQSSSGGNEGISFSFLQQHPRTVPCVGNFNNFTWKSCLFDGSGNNMTFKQVEETVIEVEPAMWESDD